MVWDALPNANVVPKKKPELPSFKNLTKITKIKEWDLVALAVKLRVLGEKKKQIIAYGAAFGSFLPEAFWESELPKITLKFAPLAISSMHA